MMEQKKKYDKEKYKKNRENGTTQPPFRKVVDCGTTNYTLCLPRNQSRRTNVGCPLVFLRTRTVSNLTIAPE